MSAPERLSFSLFPQLPTELRFEIWRLCLPYRVLELHYPTDETVFSPREPPWWYETNDEIAYYNTRVPVIARVCRESRQVVFETWAVLASLDPDHPAFWSERWDVHLEPWFDRIRTDYIYLGWAPCMDMANLYTGDPIRHLIWVAGQTDHSRVVISMDFLLEHSGNGKHDTTMWKTHELADLMRQMPEWTFVIDGSVMITADVETAAASGLFGLLADSRVQIVETDDDVQLNRFFALDGALEFTLSLCKYPAEPAVAFNLSRFQEEIELSKSWISEAIGDLFPSEENVPRYHVAVMFRLCTNISGQ
ncbi:hypothetical protein BR93DRAFT_976785 [Coniochaeta sp. PMI_546]|nr:hypothetical protein BR93DRAFT_976785 [Coniochaeta sp. PMI_546]